MSTCLEYSRQTLKFSLLVWISTVFAETANTLQVLLYQTCEANWPYL